MKKKLLLFLLVLLIPLASLCFGANTLQKIDSCEEADLEKIAGQTASGLEEIAGLSYEGGGLIPDWTEDFTTGDTGDVDGNTAYDTETDTQNKLEIVSNILIYTRDADATAYVREDHGTQTEITLKFKIKFSVVAGFDNYKAHKMPWLMTSTVSGNIMPAFDTAATGTIDKLRGTYYNDAGEQTPDIVSTSAAQNTWYDVVYYFKQDSDEGDDIGGDDGVVYVKFGAVEIVNLTDVDNDTKNVKYQYMGVPDDGSLNIDKGLVISFDDVEVYLGVDAR